MPHVLFRSVGWTPTFLPPGPRGKEAARPLVTGRPGPAPVMVLPLLSEHSPRLLCDLGCRDPATRVPHAGVCVPGPQCVHAGDAFGCLSRSAPASERLCSTVLGRVRALSFLVIWAKTRFVWSVTLWEVLGQQKERKESMGFPGRPGLLPRGLSLTS